MRKRPVKNNVVQNVVQDVVHSDLRISENPDLDFDQDDDSEDVEGVQQNVRQNVEHDVEQHMNNVQHQNKELDLISAVTNPNRFEQLEIRYVRLSIAAQWDWDENPKEHDIGKICQAIRMNGFIDPPKFDPNIGEHGGFIYGNGRTKALLWMWEGSEDLPRGIAIDVESNEWAMPVVFGVDAKSQAMAITAAIDHNNLSLAGGTFSAYDMSKMYDMDKYMVLLTSIDILPVTVDEEDIETLKNIDLTGLMKQADDESENEGKDQTGDGERDALEIEDGWPVIKAKMRPDLYATYLEYTAEFGDNDDERLEGLISQYKAAYAD